MAKRYKEEKELIEMIKAVNNMQNKLAVFLLNNKNYSSELSNLIKKANYPKSNICYVCLTKPYAEVAENLKDDRVNTDNFTFVDVLSNRQYPLKPVEKCIFVSGMENLNSIKKAITKAINKEDCKTVIFDTISTLLIYQQADKIIKFTHELLTDENQKKASKVYVILKEKGIYKDESTKLINDLHLFADKVFEM